MSDVSPHPPNGIFDLGHWDGVSSFMTAGHGPLPLNCDWAWRAAEFYQSNAISQISSPQSGMDIGPSSKLFYNGTDGQISVFADVPAMGSGPIGLGLAIYEFTGDFLSLAFAVPDAAAQGMTKFTLFQCDVMTVVDHPVTFYLRLNVRYAATVATFTQAVKTSGGHVCATFDLGFHRFEVGEFSKIWLDVMINSPQHNRIIVNDLTLLRHPWGQF